MYRFSKVLGPLSVRSSIQLCHRQPPSLSLSSSSAAAAAAAHWVTTINRKSFGNLDKCGYHGESNSHNTNIVDHQIRLFSGQTAGSKKKTKKGQQRKKKAFNIQKRNEEKNRLKNLSHQAKLDEILSRCDDSFLDYDFRQESMRCKGWVRVQLVFSQSKFKRWCNAHIFMEALRSPDGLDQYDVIYNHKVVEIVELNELKRKQLKIKQVEKSEDYLWKVRLEWFRDEEKINDINGENDMEIAAQNEEFERCLDEYMRYFGPRLSKKVQEELRRLNCCAHIDEELEELPSEIINDDRSSPDLKYALMRHKGVTKEYLDIFHEFDENSLD